MITTNRSIYFAATVSALFLVANAAFKKANPSPIWPWGQPIRSITVRGFHRTAVLSDPQSLRYVAMTAGQGTRFYFRNGAPSVPFSKGEYFATVRFCTGQELYREFFARRYPRSLCFSRNDPRSLKTDPGGVAPVVPLYHPLPRALARFWRFLATPGDRGTRCFGPQARPLGIPKAPFVRDTATHSFAVKRTFGGFFPPDRIVFSVGGMNVNMKDKASIGYLDASQYFFPAVLGTHVGGCVSKAAIFRFGKRAPFLAWVAAQRYPRALIFSKASNFEAPGLSHCPLYGPLPTRLYAAYEALLRGGRAKENQPHTNPAATTQPALPVGKVLPGAGLPIIRIVFANRFGTVVTLKDNGQIDRRQQSSINYIERSQRYFGWGFLGKDNSPRYAAMFFIRGRKMPEMSWVAVEKYPREFIFTPTNAMLRNNFVRLPQIRCPLYGPLPKALYAAYEKLLNNRSETQRRSEKGK